MTNTLADHIQVSTRFAKSVNLERDLDRLEPLNGYVVTDRVVDTIERVIHPAATTPGGGAWSLTGPYGSGKSSCAVMLAGLLSEAGTTRDTALGLVDSVSPDAGQLVRQAHRQHGTEQTGFYRGVVTAGHETLNQTVARALHQAATRNPDQNQVPMTGPLRALSQTEATPPPDLLVEAARKLAEHKPLLLTIDEFGKTLESAQHGNGSDPYLLQQLAEAGQSSVGYPIFLVTLQHLSFGDYLLGYGGGTHHQEWAKVQGRFEDIPYTGSPAETRQIISDGFVVNNQQLWEQITRWAASHADSMQHCGLQDLTNPDVIASCYPLHPLASLILPELCSRYGQHERTLFTFLADTVQQFLNRTEHTPDMILPSVGLDLLYDYFVSASTANVLHSGRWGEIVTRLRDIHGLTSDQTRLAKTVAILNLVSEGGTVRASEPVLQLTDPTFRDVIYGLVNSGLVVYRPFADEYRIWKGSDVDVTALLDDTRSEQDKQTLTETLCSIDHTLVPVVAARHSAVTHTLRVFKQCYTDASAASVLSAMSDQASAYDGLLLRVTDLENELPAIDLPAIGKPVVAAIPHDLSEVDHTAREVAAVNAALNTTDVLNDWVTRQELGERLAHANIRLGQALYYAYQSEECGWWMLNPTTTQWERLNAGRGSAPLSDACDLIYHQTPVVRNEMLNRVALTPQGSKARRVLLEAMITHPSDPGLGLSGHGPEVAMYQAMLSHTGIHVDGCFIRPSEQSFQPAWDAMVTAFQQAEHTRVGLEDIHKVLLASPFGMKRSAVPVMMMAGLLGFSDSIAVYEHGTFKPSVTPEMAERMVRNPSHFAVKHYANVSGARQEVIKAIASRFDVPNTTRQRRVSNVLDVVSVLVSRAARLNNHTRKTLHLSDTAAAGRDILLSAVEPDMLLFYDLPTVLGYPEVPANSDMYPHSSDYAEALADMLSELEAVYPLLLERLLKKLSNTLSGASRQVIAQQAETLATNPLDPNVRPFVLALSNSDERTSDTDWAATVGTVIVRKAPTEWSDEDVLRYDQEISYQVAAFRRLAALHASNQTMGDDDSSGFRVVFTRPDGVEDIRFVRIPSDIRSQISSYVDRLLSDVAEIAGSQELAYQCVIATVGEKLLSPNEYNN